MGDEKEVYWNYRMSPGCMYELDEPTRRAEGYVECEEPAVAHVWWTDEDDKELAGGGMWLCAKHLAIVKAQEEAR